MLCWYRRAACRWWSLAMPTRCSSSERGSDSYTSPLELTEGDVSKVYCVQKEEMRQIFPTSLPSRFVTEMEVLGKACWLLRKQSYSIIQDLRKLDTSRVPHPPYLLYGSDGCGKTTALHQILHYCVKAGWMVVFVPNVFSWTHSRHELQPSPWQPGTYDQPEAASHWLKSFRSLNTHFTAQVRLSQDWVWGKRESSSAGDELNSVIDKGLVKPLLATTIAAAVMEELVKTSDRFKMVLAVDEFNGCFNPTSLKTPSGQWAEPQELNLVRTILHHLLKFPGPVLLSLSRTGMLRHSVSSWRPDDLLNKGVESRGMLQACCPVEVGPYSRDEMEAHLNYYIQHKWVNKDLSSPQLSELWHLSTGSPAVIKKLCSSL